MRRATLLPLTLASLVLALGLSLFRPVAPAPRRDNAPTGRRPAVSKAEKDHLQPVLFQREGRRAYRATTRAYTASLRADRALVRHATDDRRPGAPPTLTLALAGADADAPLSGIANGGVLVRGAYPGVDVHYHDRVGRLECDFIVAPGARPGRIAFRVEGAPARLLNGDLLLGEGAQPLVLRAPVLYQDLADGRHAVEGRYQARTDGSFGFEVGAYDASSPLVIDPVLDYSVFLWGATTPLKYIFVDALGQATIICGDSSGGNNLFKLDAAGLNAFNFVHIGDFKDMARDAAGNLYFAGSTVPSNLTTTAGAFQYPHNSAITDAYVLKLDSDFNWVAGAYIGGNFQLNNETQGLSVAVDGAGAVYVAGTTNADDFPIKAGGFLTTKPSGQTQPYLIKLKPDFSDSEFCTYLSDSAPWPEELAVDPSGNAYLAGPYGITDFPYTAHLGLGFIQKMSADGSSRDYVYYAGGTITAGYYMGPYDLDVNAAGEAYLSGWDQSPGFEVTAGAYSNTGTAFVLKLNAAGTAPIYATRLSNATFTDMDLRPDGSVVLTGKTSDPAYPVTAGAYQGTFAVGSPFSTDGFITQLNAAGDGLVYSTFVRGDNGSEVNGVAIGADEAVYIIANGGTNYPWLHTYGVTSGGPFATKFAPPLLGTASPTFTPSPMVSPTATPTVSPTSTPLPAAWCSTLLNGAESMAENGLWSVGPSGSYLTTVNAGGGAPAGSITQGLKALYCQTHFGFPVMDDFLKLSNFAPADWNGVLQLKFDVYAQMTSLDPSNAMRLFADGGGQTLQAVSADAVRLWPGQNNDVTFNINFAAGAIPPGSALSALRLRFEDPSSPTGELWFDNFRLILTCADLSRTPTPSPSPSASPSPTRSASASPSPSATGTPSPAGSPTRSPTVSPSPSPSPTATRTPNGPCPQWLFDDFEGGGGGINQFGGNWTSVLNGAAQGGNFTDPGAAATVYAAYVSGTVNTGAANFAIFQGNFTLFDAGGPGTDMAVLGVQGVKFWMKGDGHGYRFNIRTDTVTDSDYYGVDITPTAGVWTLYQFNFSDLTREGWGAQTGLPLHPPATDVRGLQWVTHFNGAAYAYSLDEISFFCAPGTPTTTPSPTASPSPTVPAVFSPTWSATAMPSSTQSPSPSPTLTRTPVPGHCPLTWVDDFEHPGTQGTSLLGYAWTGSASGVTYSVSYGLPAAASTSYAAHVSGTLADSSAYLVWYTQGSAVNASAWGLTGIDFWFYGDGHDYRLNVLGGFVTDFDWYGVDLTPPAGVWTRYQIPFNTLTRSGWGTQTGLPPTLDYTQVMGVALVAGGWAGGFNYAFDELAYSCLIPLATPTATPSFTVSATFSVTSSATPSRTATPVLSPTLSATITPSATASPSASPTPTRSASPTPSPNISPTPSPSISRTPSPSPSASPTPTRSASPTPVACFYPQALFTDFESGDKTAWVQCPGSVIAFDDSYGTTIGSSFGTGSPLAFGSPGSSYCINGTIAKKVGNPTFAALQGFAFPGGVTSAGTDIEAYSPSKLLRFSYRTGTPGISFTFQVATANVTDYGYYGFAVNTTDTAWHQVTVYFPDGAGSPKLGQPGWAIPQPWSASHSQATVLQVQIDGNSIAPLPYDLCIDDIVFDTLPTVTPTPSATLSPVVSATPTSTASPVVSATPSPTRTATRSATPSPTLTATRSRTPGGPSSTPTASLAATGSATPTATATPTASPTATGSGTPSATPSVTPTASPTATGPVYPGPTLAVPGFAPYARAGAAIIFPSPVRGPQFWVGLLLDRPGQAKVTVFNERGDVAALQTQSLGAGPQVVRMDASAFADGVYFVLCAVDDGQGGAQKLPVQKFVVLR